MYESVGVHIGDLKLEQFSVAFFRYDLGLWCLGSSYSDKAGTERPLWAIRKSRRLSGTKEYIFFFLL